MYKVLRQAPVRPITKSRSRQNMPSRNQMQINSSTCTMLYPLQQTITPQTRLISTLKKDRLHRTKPLICSHSSLTCSTWCFRQTIAFRFHLRPTNVDLATRSRTHNNVIHLGVEDADKSKIHSTNRFTESPRQCPFDNFHLFRLKIHLSILPPCAYDRKSQDARTCTGWL
jgi:hypothetical protein